MTPPGRALAGWWRHFAPLAPLRLWFADLTVFRLEALTRCAGVVPLSPVVRAVWDALALFPSSTTESLTNRLGLPLVVVHQFLTELSQLALATQDANGTWTVTGIAAPGEIQQSSLERRTFCFLAPLSADAPTFIPLTATGTPTAADAPPHILTALRECLTQPATWRQSHGFPTDVTEILDATEESPDAPTWLRVPVCQSERILLAMIQLADTSIRGFAVAEEGWSISSDFALNLSPGVVLPGMTDDPGSAFTPAWREWCQPVRGASPEDVAAVTLDRVGHRLRVCVPQRLLEKLKVSRPEAFRGDAWLLAGSGPVRAAAELEIDGR